MVPSAQATGPSFPVSWAYLPPGRCLHTGAARYHNELGAAVGRAVCPDHHLQTGARWHSEARPPIVATVYKYGSATASCCSPQIDVVPEITRKLIPSSVKARRTGLLQLPPPSSAAPWVPPAYTPPGYVAPRQNCRRRSGPRRAVHDPAGCRADWPDRGRWRLTGAGIKTTYGPAPGCRDSGGNRLFDLVCCEFTRYSVPLPSAGEACDFAVFGRDLGPSSTMTTVPSLSVYGKQVGTCRHRPDRSSNAAAESCNSALRLVRCQPAVFPG